MVVQRVVLVEEVGPDLPALRVKDLLATHMPPMLVAVVVLAVLVQFPWVV
jgi:hypothetical protein